MESAGLRSYDLPVDPASGVFGGDAAFGPENVITAVAHGHQAAVSIDLYCNGQNLEERLPPFTNLMSQKMGIHEWTYDNGIANDLRYQVPHEDKNVSLKDRKVRSGIGL